MTVCLDCGTPVYRESARCRPCRILHDQEVSLATFPDRFWSKVDRRGPDECWPWQERSRHLSGYGVVAYPGLRRVVGAHRVALELHLGRRLAPGEEACHRCDNPPCCNPAHLFVGSQSDNLVDMSSKGRHGVAKLRVADIPIIRARLAAGETHRAIAIDFGVTETTVDKVASRRTWSHVA